MAGPRLLSSTKGPLLKRIRALAVRSNRDAEGRFVLDGVRLIEEAVAADVPLELCLYDPSATHTSARLAALIRTLRDRGVRLVPATPHVVAAASQVETPQGIVAVAGMPRTAAAAVLDDAALLLVVADGIQDPGNLGAIVRIADAAAATAVAVTGAAADPHHPKTVRATMGSLFHLPVFEMETAALIGVLRERAVRVLVADQRGAIEYSSADYRPPVALVFGSEAHGPDPRWTAAAAAMLRIPIYGRAESLNVAMAAGLLLYEARRALRGAEARK
ncbi:MAG TPA: RNA methyltransferase [bacterium]|nr:RNA methyltransferase [bacterium]